MRHWTLTAFLIFSVFGATAQRIIIAEYPMSAFGEKYFIELDTSNNLVHYNIGTHPAGTHQPIELIIPIYYLNKFKGELQEAAVQYKKLKIQPGMHESATDIDVADKGQDLFARYGYTHDGRYFISKPLFTKYRIEIKDGSKLLTLNCIEDTNNQTGGQEGAVLTFSNEKEIGFFISCFDQSFTKKYMDEIKQRQREPLNTTR